MTGKVLLAKFCATLDEARREGASVINGGTELRLRVTHWSDETWVCAVDWYKRLDRKPQRTQDIVEQPYLLLAGGVVCELRATTYDAAEDEVVLVLRLKARR